MEDTLAYELRNLDAHMECPHCMKDSDGADSGFIELRFTYACAGHGLRIEDGKVRNESWDTLYSNDDEYWECRECSNQFTDEEMLELAKAAEQRVRAQHAA